MILSDKDIKRSLKEGRITIDPLFPHAIQPASVDLHLGPDFLIFRTEESIAIDPKEPIDHMMDSVTINEKRNFIIHPGEFALGITYEVVGVADDIVGRLEGKSSLGRIGLIIHATGSGSARSPTKLAPISSLTSRTSRDLLPASSLRARCRSVTSYQPPRTKHCAARGAP